MARKSQENLCQRHMMMMMMMMEMVIPAKSRPKLIVMKTCTMLILFPELDLHHQIKFSVMLMTPILYKTFLPKKINITESHQFEHLYLILVIIWF